MKKVDSYKNYTPIGKIYTELQAKDHSPIPLRELQEEFNRDYMDNLLLAALSGKKVHDIEIFYVVVLMKRERLMPKVLRNYFTSRKTCPTPNYDQTVYKFNSKTEELSFLWVIPSPKICNELYANRLDLNIKENPVLPYVIDFKEGRLLKKARMLNSEI